jgi:RNA polymerase sigma factor (TIGR02999 family)
MPEAGSNDSQPSAVSLLLERIRSGSQSAFHELVPLVYEELRGLAHAQRLHWRGDHTLNTGALVHEAYLKLSGTDEPDWESHAHFQSVAARAMRQILIDYSRSKRSVKRGGRLVRVSLEDLKVPGPAAEESNERVQKLVALNEALERLERLDQRQGRIVECRFFGGMTISDTAAALGVSPATVKRDWAVAKAWLYQDMQQALGG